jgi:hypothetical protein
MRIAAVVRLFELLGSVVVFLTAAAISRAEFADVISVDTVAETATGEVGGVSFTVDTTLEFANVADDGGFDDGAAGGSVTNGTDTSFNSPNFTPPLPMADSLTLWASSDFRITFAQPVTDLRLHIFELANNQLAFTTDGSAASLALVSSDGDMTVGPGTIKGLDGGDNASGTFTFDGDFSVLAWTSDRVTPGDAIRIQFSAVAVPEPSCVALVAVVAAFISAWRRLGIARRD